MPKIPPKKSPEKPHKKTKGEGKLGSLEGSTSDRDERRHAEMLAAQERMIKIQERFVKVNERISWATLVYAVAATAMLTWSVTAFFLA